MPRCRGRGRKRSGNLAAECCAAREPECAIVSERRPLPQARRGGELERVTRPVVADRQLPVRRRVRAGGRGGGSGRGPSTAGGGARGGPSPVQRRAGALRSRGSRRLRGRQVLSQAQRRAEDAPRGGALPGRAGPAPRHPRRAHARRGRRAAGLTSPAHAHGTLVGARRLLPRAVPRLHLAGRRLPLAKRRRHGAAAARGGGAPPAARGGAGGAARAEGAQPGGDGREHTRACSAA